MGIDSPQKGSREKAWLKRKEQEFIAYHDSHANELFRHVMLRIRDREVAHDIVQESFARTWDYIAKGKQVDYLRAFLYRVANNLIVDTVRRRHTTSLDAKVEDDGYEVPDEATRDPSEIGDARKALKLLSLLDPDARTVVAMRFIDGLSPKEISRALRLSENVVSVRIHRAIERLKRDIHKPTLDR